MDCSACGHPNRETARFCENCAAPLAHRCPTYQTDLRPAARFCDGRRQILVSALLKELTESAGAFTFAEEQTVALKGPAGRHRVVAVRWDA
jgi:Double zinc ribbon